MAPRPSRRRPIRVQVDSGRVEGKIELSDIITRLHRNAMNEARRARRDPDVPNEVAARFQNVGQLARQLATELSELETRGHRLRTPPTKRHAR
jgi:hypothetical protein